MIVTVCALNIHTMLIIQRARTWLQPGTGPPIYYMLYIHFHVGYISET